jgi:hypothetical protein
MSVIAATEAVCKLSSTRSARTSIRRCASASAPDAVTALELTRRASSSEGTATLVAKERNRYRQPSCSTAAEAAALVIVPLAICPERQLALTTRCPTPEVSKARHIRTRCRASSPTSLHRPDSGNAVLRAERHFDQVRRSAADSRARPVAAAAVLAGSRSCAQL